MPLSAWDILIGIVIPALIAFVPTWAMSLSARGRTLLRFAMPVALAAGFVTGCWLLPLAPVVPKLDRDWLPYAALFALVPAVAPARGWLGLAIKSVMIVASTIGLAYVLVPTWATLEPSRPVHMIVWSSYTIVLSVAMAFFTFRHGGLLDSAETAIEQSDSGAEGSASTGAQHTKLLLVMIIGCLLGGFALLALSGSLRFGQASAACMGAAGGLLLAVWLMKQHPPLDGVAIVAMLVICAAVLTGKVNSFSSIPTLSYALLPLTPLAIGFAPRQGQQAKSIWGTVVPLVIAIAVCGLSLGIAAFAEFS